MVHIKHLEYCCNKVLYCYCLEVMHEVEFPKFELQKENCWREILKEEMQKLKQQFYIQLFYIKRSPKYTKYLAASCLRYIKFLNLNSSIWTLFLFLSDFQWLNKEITIIWKDRCQRIEKSNIHSSRSS